MHTFYTYQTALLIHIDDNIQYLNTHEKTQINVGIHSRNNWIIYNTSVIK